MSMGSENDPNGLDILLVEWNRRANLLMVAAAAVAILSFSLLAYINLTREDAPPYTPDEIACAQYLRSVAFAAGDRTVPSIAEANEVCREFIEENGPGGFWNRDREVSP